jgi:hypothetical protein
MEIHFPQLDEIKKQLQAMNDKIDALATSSAQLALPFANQPQPVPEQPKPATDKPRKAKKAPVAPVAPPTINGENLDEHVHDDEDTLRARVAFEGKRVQRLFGIGGLRSAIKKVTGENILQIDDVPVPNLSALLDEPQAM